MSRTAVWWQSAIVTDTSGASHKSDAYGAIFSTRRKECLVDIRMEVLEAISDHLRRYRSISLRLQPSRQRRAGKKGFSY
ncbi:hypothetical protein J6590_016107 [Homalodisca vitripennis]|nr:hypothetical protein J6590_016107 [Homalodisca vitripennis]